MEDYEIAVSQNESGKFKVLSGADTPTCHSKINYIRVYGETDLLNPSNSIYKKIFTSQSKTLEKLKIELLNIPGVDYIISRDDELLEFKLIEKNPKMPESKRDKLLDHISKPRTNKEDFKISAIFLKEL
jgi:hypothetical protein